jgi:hypothetical protein
MRNPFGSVSALWAIEMPATAADGVLVGPDGAWVVGGESAAKLITGAWVQSANPASAPVIKRPARERAEATEVRMRVR